MKSSHTVILSLFFFFFLLVDQQDVELDLRFLVAASTVFLSMSFRIISELVDYIRRNPEIINVIDREINNFMVRKFIPGLL